MRMGSPPHLWNYSAAMQITFDVSLDYIFARTDKPQGVIYEFKPKAAPEREEMRRFIEMCFDPQSPMNEKLKETLFRMMEDGE